MGALLPLALGLYAFVPDSPNMAMWAMPQLGGAIPSSEVCFAMNDHIPIWNTVTMYLQRYLLQYIWWQNPYQLTNPPIIDNNIEDF